MTCTERFGPNADAVHALIERARALDEADVQRLAQLGRRRTSDEGTALMQIARRALLAAQADKRATNAAHDVLRALLERHPGAAPGARTVLADAAYAISLRLILSESDCRVLAAPWLAFELGRVVRA